MDEEEVFNEDALLERNCASIGMGVEEWRDAMWLRRQQAEAQRLTSAEVYGGSDVSEI